MPPEHRPVYLDTCAILAAMRSKCWKALRNRFKLHTVRECREELARGNPLDPDHLILDMLVFDQEVVVHEVGSDQIGRARLASPSVAEIDPGERDLLACCHGAAEAYLLTTGDRAAVVAACRLGLGDRLISLEELAQLAGLKPILPNQFTKCWLAKLRADFLTEETAQ